MNIDGFKSATPVGDTLTLPVYSSELGSKPLIILHELPGMTPSFIDYCQRMAAAGFKVYMPLLFKSPGTEMNGFQSALFCISREFRDLFSAVDQTHARPFTAWLLELVQHVSSNHPGSKIGVIGMCLTGGFSIAAIAHSDVKAAIACQPSFPFFRNITTLGLSDSERAGARQGASELPAPCVKAYRFERDRICKDQHMNAAADLLNEAFERHPDIPGRGHSTLTGSTANPQVYDDVLAFLTQRL